MEVTDMCARICRHVLLVSAGIILSLVSTSHGYVIVVNYDNHPDLEKAKEYDLTIGNERFERTDGSFDRELYKSYVAKASRELAEQHYLAYLQDVDESFQRAAVYARLGDLFNGITDAHVATTIDRGKARMYYRKALEAEPKRVGWATLHARGFFATDANTDEQRFASYMDYYQWLLSIDEKKLKENWLPTRPAREVTPPRQEDEMHRKRRERFEQSGAKSPARPRASGAGFLGDIKEQAEVTAYNLVHNAKGRMGIDPQTHQWSQGRAIQHLIMLVERFPGTSVAERAKAELARLASDVADEALSVLEDDLNAYWRTAFLPTASRVDANEPYILDLVGCRFLLPPGRLHTEETFTWLAQQRGDHLAWDGAFVMPTGSRLAVAPPTMPGTLNVVTDQWSVGYELPKGAVFPYHLWLIAKSGRRYVLRVTAVRPEGVKFYYRTVTNKEFEARARAAAAPRPEGKSSPPQSTR
jgi:hypothetical protein